MAHGSLHRLPPPGAAADDAVRVVVGAGPGNSEPFRLALERSGLTVVAEAETAREALSAMVRTHARACILDAALPGDRDWAIRTIRASLPDAVVVLIAPEASDEEVIGALNAGAAVYLCGPSAAAHAAEAIALARQGHMTVPLATLARLARRARWLRPETLPASRTPLTQREREVFEALRTGATTAEIAADLGLSAVTVRRHVSGVVRKVGGSSRDALLPTGNDPSPAPSAPGDGTARGDAPPLSGRELQVLRLAAAGWANQAIADELVITPSTVKNHLTRIMAKLGARNRTEAAVLAARHGQL